MCISVLLTAETTEHHEGESVCCVQEFSGTCVTGLQKECIVSMGGISCESDEGLDICSEAFRQGNLLQSKNGSECVEAIGDHKIVFLDYHPAWRGGGLE